jgi:hypothetical protein
MKKTLAYCWVEGFIITVHTEQAPSSQERTTMVSDPRLASYTGALIYTLGGSPGALQRKQLRDAISSKETCAAVLTSSAIARAAITALNLFTRNAIRAFAPSDLEQALTHLKAPESLRPQLKTALAQLKQELQILGIAFGAR